MLMISGLLSNFSVTLLYTLEPNFPPASGISLFMLIFGAIFVSAWVWSLQSSWYGWFGRLLHRERSSYAAARTFGQRLISRGEWTMETLPDAMTESLCAELELEQAAIWIWKKEESAYRLTGASGKWPIPPPKWLRSMDARVQSLDGEFRFRSSPGEGARVEGQIATSRALVGGAAGTSVFRLLGASLSVATRAVRHEAHPAGLRAIPNPNRPSKSPINHHFLV